MTVFAVTFEHPEKGKEFMRGVQERFHPKIARSMRDISMAFLHGNIKEAKGFYIVEVSPNLPPFYILPIAGIISLYLFNVQAWWYYTILSLLFLFQLCWYNSWFYIILLNQGSKKAGAGTVYHLSRSEALRRVAGWDK